MRIPLWARLFFTFAALSVVGLAVLTLVQKRTFQRDFLTYVNQQATARVTLAAQDISKRYESIGSWRFIADNPRLFHAILEGNQLSADDPALMRPLAEDRRLDARSRRPPPKAYLDGTNNRESSERGEIGEEATARFDDRAPPKRGPRGDRRATEKRIDALNIRSRVLLLDERDKPVVGNPAVPPASPSIPILANGKPVGRLLLATQPALESDLDVAFVQSQARHALYSAIGVLAAALLVALVLARWLLGPVKTLGQHMQKLAAGEYHERISTSRRDELGDLARNYNRLADILARNQEARRTWGADIAHELRTPLSILRGEIQAMQEGVRPLSKDGLNSLEAECARLTALVEDLYQLTLSDVGALAYVFELCDLNALIHDVADEHARSLKSAGLNVQMQLATGVLPIRADAKRLAQLLSNCLTNCQRYTDAPGTVLILTERHSGSVIMHIDDSPPGVPTQLLPKLFDRLFRVESSRSRAAGGAGLGLAICMNIAKAHDGSLTASASSLGGLRITLTLPLATTDNQN
jgi:two-component system, OmpR family, sensor histidine kinase BaeS